MTEEKQKKGTPEKPAKAPRTTQANESIVLIGKKPVMNYVVACLTVDTIELLRRAFAKDLQLQGISINTEEVTRAEGQKANVSAIEITVTKP